MTLVKIGQTILNFDRLTSVRNLTTAGAGGPLVVEFEKGHTVQIQEGAGLLRSWLEARAVVPAAPSDGTSTSVDPTPIP